MHILFTRPLFSHPKHLGVPEATLLWVMFALSGNTGPILHGSALLVVTRRFTDRSIGLGGSVLLENCAVLSIASSIACAVSHACWKVSFFSDSSRFCMASLGRPRTSLSRNASLRKAPNSHLAVKRNYVLCDALTCLLVALVNKTKSLRDQCPGLEIRLQCFCQVCVALVVGFGRG